MNFTNVSAEVNGRLTTEVNKAANTKSHNKGIVAALLAAAAEVDPVAKESGCTGLDTSLTTATRNKPTCSFLKSSLKKAEDYPEADRKLYPPYGTVIDGNDVSTLVVLQSEYGVIVPPIPEAPTTAAPTSSGSEGAAEGKKEEFPTAYIGSPDATSCIVVGARAHLVDAPNYASATAIGHFDRDGADLIEGVRGMYFKSLLPAMGDQLRLFRERGGTVPAPATAATATASTGGEPRAAIVVEWYFVGGMINDQYTLPCMSDLLSGFFRPMFEDISLRVQEQMIFKAAGGTSKFAVQHALRADGLCFWSLNTYKDAQQRHTCIVRGLRINALDGSCEPFEVRAGKSNFPFVHVRGTRFITQSTEDGAIVPICVRPSDGVRNLRYVPDEPPAPARKVNKGPTLSLDYVQYLACVRHAIVSKIALPIVVPAASFDGVSSHYINITADQASKMSTTPHCEPFNFAPRLASNFHYAAQASTAGVFGSPAMPLTNAVLPPSPQQQQ